MPGGYGPKGSKGDQGDYGLQGPQGLVGSPGSEGSIGEYYYIKAFSTQMIHNTFVLTLYYFFVILC